MKVSLDHAFRLGDGEEAVVEGTDLSVRCIGLTRTSPEADATGFGDELTLSLEVAAGDRVSRRRFSWWEHDGNAESISWAVPGFTVVVEGANRLRVARASAGNGRVIARRNRTSSVSTSASHRIPSHTGSRGTSSAADLPSRGGRHRRRRHRWGALYKLRTRLRSTIDSTGALMRKVQNRLNQPVIRRRRGKKSRGSTRALRFGLDSDWAWSLKIYRGHWLLGEIRAANPLALIDQVEEPYVRLGGPRPEYSVVLCSSATRRKLKVTSDLLAVLRSPDADAVLATLDPDFRRHTHRDSSSVTVMADAHGRPVNATRLLATIFGDHHET